MIIDHRKQQKDITVMINLLDHILTLSEGPTAPEYSGFYNLSTSDAMAVRATARMTFMSIEKPEMRNDHRTDA
ncbi:MAG: hypothetical protein R3330_13865 [Saprospiraceae bacterium]|nr:hypothetical protein [Saprospiraceae bacterium]